MKFLVGDELNSKTALARQSRLIQVKRVMDNIDNVKIYNEKMISTYKTTLH